MAQNLFNLSQTAATESNKPLVSFRAGKCTFANGTVTPINKKGLVQVLQTPDSLLHFQWKDRTTGTVEDDLIIFPDEAQFVKAKPDARVLLLKFTSGRKLFFWLQEPKDDKDKEYEEKTNQYLNNPPSPDSAMSDDDDVGLSGMDESQLRQMFQNVGAANQARPEPTRAPATTTTVPAAATPTPTAATTPAPATTSAPTTTAPVPATTTPTPATTNTSAPTTSTPSPAPSATPTATPPATTVNTTAPRQASSGPANQAQLSADMAASLSSILAGFGMPQAQQGEDTDLQEVLLPELILPVLTSDPDALKELFSHLPQGTQNLAGLRELLFSPQFGQTIDAFTHVLHSGHANSLMTMFGFDPMLAGPVGVMDVNSFITALKASIEKNAKK